MLAVGARPFEQVASRFRAEAVLDGRDFESELRTDELGVAGRFTTARGISDR